MGIKSDLMNPNQDCGMGYIVPEWVTSKPSISDIQDIYGPNKILPATTIILPLKCEKLAVVKKHLFEIHPELLLFLQKTRRKVFPVKATNKVDARKNVDQWTISLAFPFSDRLSRGSSSVAVFAFLPTAMVTNFPFIIQAGFILTSSRGAILDR